MFFLQFGKTQTLVVNKVLEYLNKKNDVSLSVEEFKINPFGSFYATQLLIKDHHLDTLISVDSLAGNLYQLQEIKKRDFFLKDVYVKHAWVYDKLYGAELKSNLSLFSSKFKSKKKKKKEIAFFLENTTVDNLRYLNERKGKNVVDFKQISGVLKNFTLKGVDIKANTDSLSFEDVYGIRYKNLKTDFIYTSNKMVFTNSYVETENSIVNTNLIFNYTSTNDFSDFVSLVKLQGNVFDSSLSLIDLNKIYPHYKEQKSFNLAGELSGTLNDLYLTNICLSSEKEDFSVVGDVNLENTIKNRDALLVDAVDVCLNTAPDVVKTIVPDQYKKSLPSKYYGLKEINYLGNLKVSKKELWAKGNIRSNLGFLEMDTHIDDLTLDKKIINVKVSEGSVFKNKKIPGLKQARFKASVDGAVKRSSFTGVAKFNFKDIIYKNNKFKKTSLKLKTNQQGLVAELYSRDSLLLFNSKLQVQNKKEKQFNLEFDVQKAKLSKLFPENITYQQNVYGKGSVIIKQQGEETSVNGVLNDVYVDTKTDHLALGEVDVKMEVKASEKLISLKSNSLFNFKTKGYFQFADFEKLVNNALAKFIPLKHKRLDVENQNLNFELELKPKFIKTFTDKVVLKESVKISGLLESEEDKCVILASAPSITSQDVSLDSLRLVLDNSNKFLNSNLSIKNISYKNQVYDGVSLLGKKINDTLFVRSNFTTDKIANRAVFYVASDQEFLTTGIDNLYLKYANQIWVNKEQKQNKFLYNYKTKDWLFNEISLVNGKQEFELTGSINTDKTKDLKVRLQNINLDQILPKIDSLEIGGIANGEIYFKEKNKLLRPLGHLNIKELNINDVNYGVMQASVKPNNTQYGYNLEFITSSNNIHNIKAKGNVVVDKNNFSNSKINLEVDLKKLKLNSLSPLGKNVLSKIRGSASGKFNVIGELNNFNNYGEIKLQNTGLYFPYLNTDYEFLGDAKIELKGDAVVFKKLEIRDKLYKTKGNISGKINHTKFKNWELDLEVDSENLMAMNIPEKPNVKFYGTGFMEGYAHIYGPTSKLSIVVNGKTLKGTTFILPLNDLKEVEDNNFIYYKTPSVLLAEEKPKNVSKSSSGVNILLNLDITKDAVGGVVIDEVSGSSLQGRVDGRLVVEIDPFFNIGMYGDLVIEEGLYNFKYRGLVNKPFQVKKGGTVSWNGDPFKAQLNIEALHSVKANPKVLLDNLSVNRKIDIDLVTKVTGELFDSSQDFGIEIPNAGSNVKSELDFKLNIDQDTKLRQFFSLLVSKSFFDEDTSNTTSSVLTSTTSELISNAVTDIFNKSDDKFKINFGYTSGETNEIESLNVDDQIDIGVATEINDRILINGNLGVPVGTTTQSSVVGEVKVEFLLNKDGTLRTSVFNRQNEIQYSQEEEGYTQGVGLNYQINFDDFSEMIERIKKNKKTKNKQ